MIFCVEDDAGIRELMVYTLNASGFKAEGFDDGDKMFEAIKSGRPELIILDLMLPGEDGISILKDLKRMNITSDIPVIIASAKGAEYDKILGLDTGADDYLVKPFGMMEMVSRVKAVLRRARPVYNNKLLCVADIVVDVDQHSVTSDGQPVQLTLKEFELLRVFMENQGRVLSREKLLMLVWGTDFLGETRTVDVHIGTLRTKLGKCGDYIKTVRGVGYKIERGSINDKTDI